MIPEKDYKGYTANQLLNDERFVQWCLSPEDESNVYWHLLKENDPLLSEEIDKACVFVTHLRQDLYTPDFTQQEEQELWQRIRHENKLYLSRKRFIQCFKWVTAAAVFFACVWGFWRYNSDSTRELDYLSVIESNKNVASTSDDVQLVLGKDKKISIQEKESRVEYTSDGEVTVNSQMVDNMKGQESSQSLNQLIVPYGKRSSITFSDGTQIWVNSGSKVIYPTDFNTKKREIFVEGEVYLSVAHNPSVPFIVKTRLLDVLVHGTTFNVSAYDNDDDLQVTLVEGKVEVSAKGISTELKPNQQFALNIMKGNGHVRNVDVANYVAWKNGYYIFEKEPLAQVFKRLSRYYNVQIECDENVGGLTCSGKLDLKNQIDEVLGYLRRAAPICINRNEDKLIISRINKE
ncbi:FecR family protein [Phocaeicola oris]|uniref:FecR family protein n=1 Tax=Phocaeicola oris TaxID=2896850 RepID=UPI00234E51C9|nr:FecR domain-containing protein [Phocaeicola oris]MCE2616017.1 FecR domain-containing protein [Phocaeicola oris]